MLKIKIEDAFESRQAQAAQKAALIKPITYKFSINTKEASTLTDILSILPYVNTPEMRILKTDTFACFFTENKSIFTSLVDDTEGLIEIFNANLLTQNTQAQWLTQYINDKNICGTSVSKQVQASENIASVISESEKNIKYREEDTRYKNEINALHMAISNKAFDEEITAICDYIEKEFKGFGEPGALHDLLTKFYLSIKEECSPYFFANEHADQKERFILGDFVRANKPTYKSFSSFVRCDELQRPNNHKLWENHRKALFTFIGIKLPELSRNHLSALIKDEETVIPETTPFTGLKLTGCRTQTLEQRLKPRNLYYCQQEQAIKWQHVFAGALVAHYHEFLEVKQSAYIKKNVAKLADELIQNPTLELKAAITEIYKKAQTILW